MKKSDIKNGMIVEYRDREQKLVYDEQLFSLDGIFQTSSLRFYDENLNNVNGLTQYDIWSVYEPGDGYIWQRENRPKIELALERVYIDPDELKEWLKNGRL